MIFTGFKRKSNQIYFNKNWQKLLEKSSLTPSNSIKRVLVIVNNNLEKELVEKELVNLLSLSEGSIDTIIFQQKAKKEERNNGVISPKDFGWNGDFKVHKIENILTNTYDLLINYSKVENVYCNLLLLHFKTAFRRRIGHSNKQLYNFIVKCDPAEFNIFHKELMKYLKILKKI